MAAILIQGRGSRPPNWPMRLLEGHPLANGLVAFVPLVTPGAYINLVNGGGPNAQAGMTGKSLAYMPRSVSRAGSDRVGILFGGSSYLRFPLGVTQQYNWSLATGFFGSTWPSASRIAMGVCAATGSNEAQPSLGHNASNLVSMFTLSSVGGSTVHATGTTLSGATAVRCAGQVTSNVARRLHEELWTDTGNSTSQAANTASTHLYVGGRYDQGNTPGSAAWTEAIEYAAVWSRTLARAEFLEFNANPWALVTPDVGRKYFFLGRPPAAGGAITATLNKTLGPAFLDETVGQVIVTGSLSRTLGAATLAGVSDVDVVGSLSGTLGALALAGVADVDVTAQLSRTLGALTLSAVADADVTGTLSRTLGAATLAGVADVDVAGALSRTLGSLTLTGVADVDVVASLSQTLGVLTLDGRLDTTGSITATLSVTLGAATLTGVADVDVTASLSSALGTLTLAGVGDVDVAAASNITLGTLTLAGVMDTSGAVNGALDVTLGAATLTATADVDVAAALSVTLGELALAATGTIAQPPVDYALNATLGALSLAATGTTGNGPATGPGGIIRFEDAKRFKKWWLEQEAAKETRRARAKVRLGALTASGSIQTGWHPVSALAACALGGLELGAAATVDWAGLIAEEDEELLLWI